MDNFPAAGDYNQRLSIQTKTVTQNTFGQGIETWTTVQSVWAKVEPLSGSNTPQNGWMKGTETHYVEMRYCFELNQTLHRLVFNNRVLNITSALNEHERNYKYKIGATEVKHSS